jgi:general secretion pathway protein D
METLKPTIHFCRYAALIASTCWILPLSGAEPQGNNHLAGVKSTSIKGAMDEAHEILLKGDEAYRAGRYADAIEAYAGARDLIPNDTDNAAWHAAATERYAQASVEQARELARKGDLAAARAIIDQVLNTSAAPKNTGALAFRAELDDPIRTNPALTAEHAKQVDEVRQLLYTAQGAHQLGKFDEAVATYEKVLRTDPTNTAARRGMEQVSASKNGYYQAAYDNTRADMLGQVDSQWELAVPKPEDIPSLADPSSAGPETFKVSVKNKIDRIMIPKIMLDQVSLSEALDFLRLRAGENDTFEQDPARKGVNFTVNLGSPDSPAAARVSRLRFDLRLTNVPLSQALKYITETTRTTYTTDDFSVIISPPGSASAELITRTYRVPPDFLSNLSNGGGASAATDPFDAAPATKGILPKRLSAQEALASQGVTFPTGASANYSPTTNSLIVVNTSTNQDYISQVIETITKADPVMIAVRVTMIKAEQTRLQELGFDWLLDNATFGGSNGSGSNLNLSGGTQGNGGDLSDIVPPPGGVKGNPITAANRSGDDAISGDSIDSLINNPSGTQTKNRAPGVLSVYGNLSKAKFQMLMRGLDQKTGVDIMAQPSVVTRSGQASSIGMVREFMYATEYEPPEIPTSVGSGGGTTPVTPATPTAFQKKDVGITLEVLPVADADKHFVSVTLSPKFSDFDGFVNYGSPIRSTQQTTLGSQTVELTQNAILMPIFSKQAISSSVDLADGATVVVGGLMQESVQNVEDQIPILGGIPIVGRLFQSKTSKPVTTAIVFLVNVELMDPTGHRYRDR